MSLSSNTYLADHVQLSWREARLLLWLSIMSCL